jgi:hypothetical protein
MLIDDQHAILNRIHESFHELAFPGQPLDNRLHSFGMQPSNAVEHAINETGFGPWHNVLQDRG